MSDRAKRQAFEEIGAIAKAAPKAFAPLRERAETGQIGADSFHERAADLTSGLLRKLDAVHGRRISCHVWPGKDVAEIRDAFAAARRAITLASLDA